VQKLFYFLDEAAELLEGKYSASALRKKIWNQEIPGTQQKKGKREVWVISHETLQALQADRTRLDAQKAYEQMLEEWENAQRYGTHTGKRLKEETIADNSAFLRLLWVRIQKEPSIPELNPDNFEKVMWVILSDNDPKNDHYSVRQNTYKSVTSFYKHLIKRGLKSEQELSFIRKLRPVRSIPERRTSLNKEDLVRFFQANNHVDGRTHFDRELNHVLFMFYVCLGLRRSEPLKLELDSIDFQTGRITVLGKNNKWRTVYANGEMLHVLNRWVKEYRPKCRLPYLLLTKEGEAVSNSNVTTRFARIRKKAKLDGKITIHGLRRTFATFWMDQGKPIHDLKEILGHETISVTDIYIRPDKEKAAKSMRELSFGLDSAGLADVVGGESSPGTLKPRRLIRDEWD
jgi:site-specific recombinase XerD